MTALMWAARENDGPAVRFLLGCGADPSIRNPRGRRAVGMVGEPDVRALLARSRAPSAKGTADEAPPLPVLREHALLQAAKRGRLAVVRQWLDDGVDANAHDHAGWPALTVAAARGHAAILRALLDHGAKVGARGPGDWTALMQAAAHGHREAAELLLEGGARTAARNRWGETAHSLAAARNHDALADHLASGGPASESAETLIDAARLRLPELVRVLLKHCAKVNDADADGRTALFHAVLTPPNRPRRLYAKDILATLDLLIQAGADVNATDAAGRTPLMAAIDQPVPLPEAVRILLDAGAKTEVRNESGQTAQDLAVRDGREKIADLLRRAGP